MDKRVSYRETIPQAGPWKADPASWPEDGERIAPASPDAGTVAQQVAVPLLQSAISGLGAAGLVGVLGWAFWTPDPNTLGPLAASAGVLTFAASWAVIVSDCRGLLRIAESWGSPAPIPQPKAQERIIWLRGDHAQADPTPPAETEPALAEAQGSGDFERFMAACLISTALGDLERQFPRPYVQNTRDQLIRAGLGEWRGQGPRAGWQLTPRGQTVAEQCAGLLPRGKKARECVGA